jgi:hypothetical protein
MGKTKVERSKNETRRSTRLSLQIPVLIASLDPASEFREECKTVVVNAHGCGVIVRKRLEIDTPIVVKLTSNGATERGRVVVVITVATAASYLLGVEFDSPDNFWGVENPPADWSV